jgi:hypothetical protein
MPITSNNNTWASNEQRYAATALWAAENTYDYFCEKHQWNSFDGQNSPVKIEILNEIAGYWSYPIISIGGISSGSNITQDIVAHEFSHGVYATFSGNIGACTSHDNGFQLSCQLNAINESVADMFGTAVEYYALPSSASFLYGSEAVSGGIRNLSNPKSKGYPNCFKTPTYPSPVNWCVGTTDCIPNEKQYNNGAVLGFWFHLLCNGGSGRVDDNINYPAYTVGAIGIDKATKIIFRALRYYMPFAQPQNGYNNFKLATLEAAKDLYGNCANEVIQLSSAWKAVGLDAINYATSLNLCGDFGQQYAPQYQYHHISSLVSLPASSCNPQSMVVKNGSKLVLTSTQGIVLKSGFKAESGSMFKASTTSCASSTNRIGIKNNPDLDNHSQENQLQEGYQVFPNPSTGMISIRLPQEFKDEIVSCSLYSNTGILKTEHLQPFQSGTHSLNFDLKHLEDGLYFIELKPSNGNNTYLKLLIQH